MHKVVVCSCVWHRLVSVMGYRKVCGRVKYYSMDTGDWHR